MEQFHVTPVDAPKRSLSKKMIVLIAIGILLLLAAIASAVFFAFQASANSSKLTQLEADKTKLTSDIAKLKADQVAHDASNQATAGSAENAESLTDVLNDMYSRKTDITSQDEATVLAVAQKYYKAETIPDGARVVVAYQTSKTDSEPVSAVRALVYWPGKDGQPIQFLDVTKNSDKGTWSVGSQQ